MEFFTDHWLLWASFFAPSTLWILAEKARGSPLPFGSLARLCAYVSGALLVMAAMHASVELIVDRLFS
jgi:hypothetical protein